MNNRLSTEAGGAARPLRPSWDKWADERRVIIWVWPISGITIVWLTVTFAVDVFPALLNEEKTGGGIFSSPKMIAIAAMILLAFGILLYLSIGVYQMFFLELRQKFIASEVQWNGTGYQVRGYYFKKSSFIPADLVAIEEYRVEHRYLSNSILTLLCRTPKINYRVQLKDGREFYLPGDLERVSQLKAQLDADMLAQQA